jgi:ubiquitin-conjugating enzyme E2 variant
MSSVPRNFKLLDELEKAEKGENDPSISLGLITADDRFMSDWQATIFAAPAFLEPRLWFLTLHAGQNYPKEPPVVKFTSRINADFVDARGNVNSSKLNTLREWKPSLGLINVLVEIKSLISSAPRSQPADGSTF